jgi:GWxTD domain-containing protein
MVERNRAGWQMAAAVLHLVSWLAVACQSAAAKPSPPGGGGGLADGPTRWLMLPDEHKRFRRLDTTREAIGFIEDFWLRRDPDPGTPGNEFSRAFYERVEAADRLYSEEGIRGSMTDRGRALVLLGPPPTIRASQQRIPTWQPGRPGSRAPAQTRSLQIEAWIYPLTDLPPELASLIAEDDPKPQIEIVFAIEPKSTEILEGEKYLEMAARAAVRR